METEKGMEVVDVKTGELVVEAERTPEDLLLSARDAAQALERVIALNEKPPLMFNGKRYLQFEHWQVCAKFYHCSVRTFDAQPVEIGGVAGFKARAEVFDEKTGLVVGGAEAFCLRDEPNWKTKPTFQLASMAQTRAASKALGNKFRYVAVVAGYEGTPAEEMTAETSSTQKQVVMPKEKAIETTAQVAQKMQSPFPDVRKYAEDRPVDGVSINKSNTSAPVIRPPLTERPAPEGMKDDYSDEKPVSKFFAILHAKSREKAIPDEVMKRQIGAMFRKTSSKELNDSQLVQLIKFVEGWTPGDL